MTSAPVTLVTGASSGLGVAIAQRLSATRRLILSGRDTARLEKTRQSCQRADEHVVWPMDLANVSGIEASLGQCIALNDLLVEGFVHCAGVLKIGRFRTISRETVVETMNVNFMSAAEIVRVLLRIPGAGRQLRGIVFVSSTASLFGARGFNLYCASKGALDALMRALAVELAPGTRVNSVLPGGVRTDMTAQMFEDTELKARIEKDYPLGIGESTDISAAVEFLLSESARWITGQQMVVDGGRTVNITA